MYRQSYTFEERLKIKELIDQGFKIADISCKLKRSERSIENELCKSGGKKNYDPIKAQQVSNTGLISRTYTLEERLQLAELLKTPKTYAEIASLMNRTRYAISDHVTYRGGRLEYDPYPESVKRGRGCKSVSLLELYNEIESIKMQMDIITTTIQDILNAKNN